MISKKTLAYQQLLLVSLSVQFSYSLAIEQSQSQSISLGVEETKAPNLPTGGLAGRELS